MKLRGLPGVLHVRETEEPGTFDLWVPVPPTATARHRRHNYMWIELKVHKPFAATQRAFARERILMGEFLCVLRLVDGHSIAVYDHLDERLNNKIADMRQFDWLKWARHTLDGHYADF